MGTLLGGNDGKRVGLIGDKTQRGSRNPQTTAQDVEQRGFHVLDDCLSREPADLIQRSAAQHAAAAAEERRVAGILAGLVWASWVVCWVICMVQAFNGRRWKLPIAGAYAERFSANPSV